MSLPALRGFSSSLCRASTTAVGRFTTISAPACSRLFSSRSNNFNFNFKSSAQLPPFRRSNWLGVALGVGVSFIGLTATAFAEDKKGGSSPNVDFNAVRAEIANILDKDGYDDGSIGPVLVRLAWHASGTYDKATNTGGSDGATMRYAPESSDGANSGLALARAFLEPIKQKHPGITYADLWTLAGAVAVEEMGGPVIPWRPGRRDHVDASKVPPNGRLPDAAQGAQHVRNVFYRMGFNDREIVALAGAHALGRCHTDRSGFEGPWTRAPTTFSNEYFRLLLEEEWKPRDWKGPRQFANKAGDLMMLPADIAFRDDPEFRKYVEIYAKDEQTFFKDFSSAFAKLLELGCTNLAPAPIAFTKAA